MVLPQALIYACIQVVHNFGALAVLGIAISGLRMSGADAPPQRRMAIFMATAWTVQAISGAAFGVTTFYFYGHLPDIHGVAIAALLIKVTCALIGFSIALIYIIRGGGLGYRRLLWSTSCVLGAVALSSAAFLRWFS